jgi:hypothetical protein
MRRTRLGIQAGFVTINEARALKGLPPVPGRDELMFPMNYAALDNCGRHPDPALPPPVPNWRRKPNGSA